MPFCYTKVESPLGPVLVAASPEGLVRVSFLAGADPVSPPAAWVAEDRPRSALLRAASTQIGEYFEGRRRDFDLPLAPAGTPFQLRVWAALREIPYGRRMSYGALARRIGQPRAVRAVGATNGRNPLPLLIPCHRVVGADGTLVGYGEGLPIKAYLLDLEARVSGWGG